MIEKIQKNFDLIKKRNELLLALKKERKSNSALDENEDFLEKLNHIKNGTDFSDFSLLLYNQDLLELLKSYEKTYNESFKAQEDQSFYKNIVERLNVEERQKEIFSIKKKLEEAKEDIIEINEELEEGKKEDQKLDKNDITKLELDILSREGKLKDLDPESESDSESISKLKSEISSLKEKKSALNEIEYSEQLIKDLELKNQNSLEKYNKLTEEEKEQISEVIISHLIENKSKVIVQYKDASTEGSNLESPIISADLLENLKNPIENSKVSQVELIGNTNEMLNEKNVKTTASTLVNLFSKESFQASAEAKLDFPKGISNKEKEALANEVAKQMESKGFCEGVENPKIIYDKKILFFHVKKEIFLSSEQMKEKLTKENKTNSKISLNSGAKKENKSQSKFYRPL